MANSSASVDALALRYREILVEMDSGRVEDGGRPRRWNRLVNQMQNLQLQLRESAEGRAAITALIEDEVPTVRQWSATNALAWDPVVARAALEREVRLGRGMDGFDAEVTLAEYDAGRLNTAWKPK